MAIQIPDYDQVLLCVLDLENPTSESFVDFSQELGRTEDGFPCYHWSAQVATAGTDFGPFCVNWGRPSYLWFGSPEFQDNLFANLAQRYGHDFDDGVVWRLTAEQAAEHVCKVLSDYKHFAENFPSRL